MVQGLSSAYQYLCGIKFWYYNEKYIYTAMPIGRNICRLVVQF
jgi:hypothetical protein